MRTRPIFHSSAAAICGHVFCSFLALAMQKHLDDLSHEDGVVPEWNEMLRDLDRLQQVRLRHRGADCLVRTDDANDYRLVTSRPYRATAARPANCPAEGAAAVEIRP